MQQSNRGTAVFYAFDYIIGLGVFGFIYLILNGFIPTFQDISSSGAVYDLAVFLWAASLIIYLIFGPFYFWNRLKEYQP